MVNFLVSREAVKRAAKIDGADHDTRVDRIIQGASEDIEKASRIYFIPRTETRLFRWPNDHGRGTVLWMNTALISVATLQTKAQDSSPTTISADDFFLEPQEFGTPYNRIEIDLSSNAAFEPGNTPQRSISVAGEWGYDTNTKAAGTVDGTELASDSSVTSFVCSNGSLVDVGDTLLIESEKIFVSERVFTALGSVLVNDADIQASMSDNTITLDPSHGVLAGETIQLEAEQLFVISVATNDINVIRAYNGTVLAAHANDTPVHTNRTLTIVRGANGSTAATHADTTAITKYTPPSNIVNLCLEMALAVVHQEDAGMTGGVGKSGAASPFTGETLEQRFKRIIGQRKWVRFGTI